MISETIKHLGINIIKIYKNSMENIIKDVLKGTKFI